MGLSPESKKETVSVLSNSVRTELLLDKSRTAIEVGWLVSFLNTSQGWGAKNVSFAIWNLI